jgi:hypothetical protein
MENLVCSELIYMEDDAEFDLFDVRYSEGELLYYTRDDSVFLRNHRAITILLHPDLGRARFKDAELPWQRLVLVFGLLLCAVRRLHDWLGHEALLLRFVFLDGEDGQPSPLAEEKQLLGLLLREWIERGTVQVTAGRLDGALLGGEAAAVLLACEAPRAALFDELPAAPGRTRRGPAPHSVFFGVGQPRPRVRAAGLAPQREGSPTSTLAGWHEATRALLEQLI